MSESSVPVKPVPEPHIPMDRYFCDLCIRLRKGKPRNFGVDFFDSYWACHDCIAIYRIGQYAGGKVSAGAT